MSKKTIILKDYLKIREELVAAGTITPGMVVEFTSAGKVQAHSDAGGNAIPMVALEDELQGNGINDDYSVNDQVQVWIPGRGDQAYMILKDGQNITKGDLLESAGDGYLQKHVADTINIDSSAATGDVTVYPNQIIGQALESVDLSGSSGEESSGPLAYEKRIKVRIL